MRDACRMLVMDRETGAIEDRIFRDIIDYLEPGDLLVANETRVLPARLLGAKRGTGGQSEVFLLRQLVGSKAQPYADVPQIPGQPVPGENQQAIWGGTRASGQAFEARQRRGGGFHGWRRQRCAVRRDRRLGRGRSAR